MSHDTSCRNLTYRTGRGFEYTRLVSLIEPLIPLNPTEDTDEFNFPVFTEALRVIHGFHFFSRRIGIILQAEIPGTGQAELWEKFAPSTVVSANLCTGICQLTKGTANIVTGICQPTKGTANIFTGICQPTEGTANIFTGICQPTEGIANIVTGICQPTEGTANIFTGIFRPLPELAARQQRQSKLFQKIIVLPGSCIDCCFDLHQFRIRRL